MIILSFKIANLLTLPDFTTFKKYLSISSIQFANYLLPLFFYPYIVRIIGPDKFGLYSFSLTIVQYFTLVINYGFDLTATREIAKNKSNPAFLNKYVTRVFLTRLALFCFSTLIFILLVNANKKLHDNLFVLSLSYLINIGICFFPSWYFQGLGKLPILSVINFFIKLIQVVLIFTFIKKSEDFVLLALLSSLGQILVSITSIFYIFKNFDYKVDLTSVYKEGIFNSIYSELKFGIKIFISTIMMLLYTTSGSLILGFYASDKAVGYFSAASKIINIIYIVMLFPFNQVYFPLIAEKFNKNKEDAYRQLKSSMQMMAILSFLVSLFLFFFSGIIINLLYGHLYTTSIVVLRILSVLPFIIGLNSIVTVQWMLNVDMDKQFLFITMMAVVINIAVTFLFIKGQQNAAAISWVVTETFILIISILFLKNANQLSAFRNSFKI